ncbi:MAG: hypothetical protein V4541_13515 [Bacteroidota bacterium]
MKQILTVLFISLCYSLTANAQELNLKMRAVNARGGNAFARSIADSSLTLEDRENRIYDELKSGNVPDFLRNLKKITQTIKIDQTTYTLAFFVLPDYLAIGSNDDYFYVPMTPILAQRVATLLKCMLPTRKMVDLIYQEASIKLEPLPIPPTKAMTTVPIFMVHNETLKNQILPYNARHRNGELTAGHKKDVVISNKIYSESTPKVVIYGWHKLDGKAIQPLYGKHTNTWADYSHGIRLVWQKIIVNGKQTTLKKVLAHPVLAQLLSDEGIIKQPYYPITGY